MSHLRAEVARLKSELDSAKVQQLKAAAPEKQQTRSASTEAINTLPSHSTPRSSSSDKDWKAEYQKGKARFQALDQNFRIAKELLEKRKDERKRWIDHAQWLEKKIIAAEEEHGIHILEKGDRITRDDHAEKDQTRRHSPAVSLGSFGERDAEEKVARAGTILTDGLKSTAQTGDDVSKSAEHDFTDQVESENQLPALPSDNKEKEIVVKQEPSSDGPIVLYERPVKRRRHSGGATTTPVTRPIKTEPDAESSPLMSMHRCDFSPHESVDLGAEAQHMETPRKRKQPGNDMSAFQEELAQPVLNQTHKVDRAESISAPVQHVPQYRDARTSSALTPVSLNARILKPELPKAPLEKNLDKSLVRGIGALAEDGNAYAKNLYQKAPATPTLKGRLGSLLDTPTCENTTPISRSSRRPRKGSAFPSEELPLPKPRDLPFDKSARESIGDAPQIHTTPRPPMADKTNTTSKPAPPPTMKKKPRALLRHKPVSELKLDDFKINPNANEGHDFAFSEVVRDRDERACLPGCVDMHCCGKEFRALALSQKPNPPLTAAQREEEEDLLLNYLGDDHHRLASMSTEERDKLWVEAKTQDLANRYGKHRHRFSRMRSPPGFWNADFPSTQEIEAERAEAGRREKQTVQERHREAMRSGGRWLFRDE